MAGAGYKLFNTGDVLTAAQVNTYLQEQTVMVFADAAARTTALSGVLAEGMMSYLKSTDSVEVYNGSAWVSIGSSGDITGVTAGVGISGGGTSGTVTITNDMATTITAAGDIVVGTGSGTYDNLPIGTTGQVLTADTTVSPYKVKWAAATSGGANWTLANSGGTALTGAQTITISGLSNVNKILILVDSASSANASAYIGVRLNGDSGSNYNNFGLNINPQSTYNAGDFIGTRNTNEASFLLGRLSGNAGSSMQAYCFIDGCGTSGLKVLHSGSGSAIAASNNQYNFVVGGYYNSSSVITSVALYSYSGNFDNGTLYVYTSA